MINKLPPKAPSIKSRIWPLLLVPTPNRMAERMRPSPNNKIETIFLLSESCFFGQIIYIFCHYIISPNVQDEQNKMKVHSGNDVFSFEKMIADSPRYH